MKEHNHKSFIKSVYYKGKLLQAEDFVREQQYIKEKFKLINKMNHQAGVIEGLGFEKSGDDELVLHPGIAIDWEGNVILVPDKRVLKLSKFKGYTKESYTRNMYACLHYHERKIYNKEINKAEKIEETYRLGVVSDLMPLHQGAQLQQVYDAEGVKVYLQLPTRCYENGKIKVKVLVEQPEGSHVDVSIRTALQGLLTMDHKDRTSLECYSNGEDLFYEDAYNYRVISEAGEEVSFVLEEMYVKVNGEEMTLDMTETYTIPVVTEAGVQGHNKSEGPIILGRIGVKMEEETEVITKVEYLPFNQHVSLEDEKVSETHKKQLSTKTNILKLMSTEEPRADVRFDEEKNEMLFTFGLPNSEAVEGNGPMMKTGVTRIDLSQGGKAGRCYASDYIHHGLGKGPIVLQYAIEEKMVRLSGLPEPEEQLMFGDFEVFSETDVVSTVPGHKIGAVLYPEEGRFKVGVKLLEPTKLKTIAVRWWAIKVAEDTDTEGMEDQEESKVSVSIKPDKIELKKGQKIQLKATVENSNNTNVTWRILDKDGGKITQKGFYTAPSGRGVYKIEATSIADFSQSATVIVVVRD